MFERKTRASLWRSVKDANTFRVVMYVLILVVITKFAFLTPSINGTTHSIMIDENVIHQLGQSIRGQCIEWTQDRLDRLMETAYSDYRSPTCTADNTLPLSHRPADHTPDVMGTKCEPWLTRGVIPVLHSILDPEATQALEWSSGSSTVWMLPRVKRLHSIEHDRPWVDGLAKFIHDRPEMSAKWSYDWVDPKVQKVIHDQSNADYQNTSPAFVPNFISVDGANRIECVQRATYMLAPGGVFMFDNADVHQHFGPPLATTELAYWPRLEFANRVDNTTLWFKPCNALFDISVRV